MSITASAVLALSISVDAAQFAAQFTPIPILIPVFEVIKNIIQVCEKVASNRAEARQLQERCRYLILALNEQDYSISKGDSMNDIADGCKRHLLSVLELISKYATYNRWRLLVDQPQVSKDIKACHSRIDDCCREFQIRSHIRLHQWQDENEKARREDHAQLVQILQQLGESHDDLHSVLLQNREGIEAILRMLQKELAASKQDSKEYLNIQSSLYLVHKRSGELPPEVDLTAGEVRRIGKYPVAGNAAFDVWEGEWLRKDKVAMKTIRGVQVSPATRKRFAREAQIWRKVWSEDGGRYIVPFYGLHFEDGPFPYLVSPWMTNGNVMQYLERYPYVDRKDIVKGIAKGLRLLHHFPIAHGDLKGANILIDDSGQPLLADFGLSKMIEDLTGVPFTQSKGVSESYRWFAPEMCCSPGIVSTSSDIFSFAMTVLEIFTGQQPYRDIRLTTEVLFRMQNGERPSRPMNQEIIARGLDDNLWKLVTMCWEEVPEKRPTIDIVLENL